MVVVLELRRLLYRLQTFIVALEAGKFDKDASLMRY